MQITIQSIADTVGKAVVDRHFQGIKPIIGFGLNAETETDNFFGVPVQDDGPIKPAPGMEFNFGHIDAPELIVSIGAGFTTDIAAFGLQTVVRLNGQLVFLHKTLNTVFADFVVFAVIQVSPDRTISPEGVESMLFLVENRQGFRDLLSSKWPQLRRSQA